MFNALNEATLPLYVGAQTVFWNARDRFKLAFGRVRTNTAFSDEEGQGLLEYIIAIAGVLIIGGAVFALIRVIKGKYEDAGSAIGDMPVEGNW
jgi:hypothetical protein